MDISMISSFNIIFPDGSEKAFEKPIKGWQVAESISKSLAKKAVAIKINDQLQSLDISICEDCNVKIITEKDKECQMLIQHTICHILSYALYILFPKIKFADSPGFSDGQFYCDFDLEESLSTKDFEKIAKKMQEIIHNSNDFKLEQCKKADLIKYYQDKKQHYKVELLQELSQEACSIYKNDSFLELCSGAPHVYNNKLLRNFKLLKISGVYWRNNAQNKMLQRIQGIAFTTDVELKKYLDDMKEAKRRDHRILGKSLDLFHFQEEAVGQVFWHEKGMIIYREIERLIREILLNNDYSEIKTPLLLDRKLWEKSGHWGKYQENMFYLNDEDNRELALKPMNCPAHVQVFNQKQISYRDLPLRLSEFGTCHRNESSGSLNGLMRVRSFVQDDAHIFCTEDHIEKETSDFCRILYETYKIFGFNDIEVKLSTRPEVRSGSEEIWDKAEKALHNALINMNIKFSLNEGEGAFYGPKLEFVLKDCINREWQCGTLQLDFIMPERLNANFIDHDGQKKHPVMIHRAILGTFERFIGVLIEHYAGKFPLWLAPVQVVILTISNRFDDYARAVYQQFKEHGLRVEMDLSGEKINYKLRKHSEMKVPLFIIIGAQEQEKNIISLRKLGSMETIQMSREELIESLKEKISSRDLNY